jgi:threonine dehydrogenase-like Zn-dependent dehydrogenase
MFMNGRVAVMVEPLKMEFQEYKVVEPGPGSVVLKIRRTNVCGSELHIWRGHHPTKRKGVLGHEMVGEIASLGEGVTTDYAGEPVKVGDRVTAAYFLTCRKCPSCLLGHFHLCENAYEFWNKQPEEAPHFHGTFATHYYLHPSQYFYKVPDNVPDIAAASANCALSQVYFGLDKSGITHGETILIQGAGGLGLNAAAIAKEKGARVIVVDAVDSRLQMAKKFGADHVININEHETIEERTKMIHQFSGGSGVDVALEVTGIPSAFSEGIHHIRPGGQYISIGNVSIGKMTEFDPGLLTRKSISIHPVVRYNPWYLKKALQFLSANLSKYPFEAMMDAEFEFENIQDALDKSASREVTRASIIVSGS